MAIFDFQHGGRPPSWILKICSFCYQNRKIAISQWKIVGFWCNSRGRSRISEGSVRFPSLLSSPFPPLPSPPFPSPLPLPFPPLELGPLNPARGSGELTAGSGAEPQPKSNLVHSSLKIWHLVATIVIIFLRRNWSNIASKLAVLVHFCGVFLILKYLLLSVCAMHAC